MIKEFSAFLSLFRQGKELTHAATWKQRTVAANALGGVLTSVFIIARGFGHDFHLDAETLQAVSAGVAAAVCVVNAVLHVITDARTGLPARNGADDTPGGHSDESLYQG